MAFMKKKLNQSLGLQKCIYLQINEKITLLKILFMRKFNQLNTEKSYEE